MTKSDSKPRLSEIIKELDIIKKIGTEDPFISGLSYDSRDVKKGNLFFAFDGVHTDGHLYINKALENGASAVILSREPDKYKEGIAYILVPETRPALSAVASAFYGYPSKKLCVIGVTGTDGKSTTVSFIHQLLTLFNKPAGFISTVNIASARGIEKNPYRQSTPEAREIHDFLRKLHEQNAEYAVLEATSHGLSEKTARLKDIDFNVGVFTNVTHEHLEFHGSLEQYRNDKANLFRWTGKGNSSGKHFGVVNMDDVNWQLFKNACSCPVYAYSMKNREADLFADSVKQDEGCFFFRLVLKSSVFGNKETADVEFPIDGIFNISNLMAAVLTVHNLLDVSLSDISIFIKQLKPVRGRMETISMGQDFRVIVDYAHTPESFESLFPYIKNSTKKRLISVFGSAGERDTRKRALQGKVASEYSDIIILTDEDPRGEDSMKIIKEIASGCINNKEPKNLFMIPDRKQAIKYAFSIAGTGDTVICLGKGHESSIIYKNHSIPWDEIEIAKEILKKFL